MVVSSGATANATDITAFVADSDTVNSGTATLTAVGTGGTIDLTSAGGSTGYTIVSGAGTDTLKGDDGNDTFTISAAGEGNNDTIDGDAHTGGSGDTIELSTGSPTFLQIIKSQI